MNADLCQASDEAKVLVIYTGGTIGMLVGPQGYRNEPHFLTETLRCQSRFHDPFEDSLYSHAGNIETFRRWNSSGKSSPEPSGNEGSGRRVDYTLTVKSTRPTYSGGLSDSDSGSSAKRTTYNSIKIRDSVYECNIPTLITPRMTIQPGVTKRIRYAILEWDPLLDSSNVDTGDWVRIATEIELNYANFDAFVILHGTDTMCYTSSALSFLLEDLGKTVIITGAQIPLSQLRNDATDNLLGALTIAGNRCSKVSSYDLDAFNSPNFPPLVKVGIDIVVNWNDVIRQTSVRRFQAHKVLNPRVATVRLFPGITADSIRAFLKPPLEGVVIETFGSGNAPQRKDLMAALREAAQRCVIVAITQCAKGTVSDAYETGRALLEAGIIPGGDMTPECALAKLGYLLSKAELTSDQVRELVRLPLRGELTVRVKNAAYPSMTNYTDNMQNCLSHIRRLSSLSVPLTPEIMISPSITGQTTEQQVAPWSSTAAEATAIELSLLPTLIHLAAAKDDVKSLEFCLGFEHGADFSLEGKCLDAAGIVNSRDPCSGWSPLHSAAFNNSLGCVSILLRSGALVHLRDTLGHTALYYAARRGHEGVVVTLRQAGAILGGSDIENEFLSVEVSKAIKGGDQRTVDVWKLAGFVEVSTDSNRIT